METGTVNGEVFEAYADRRGTPILIVDVVSRKVRVKCWGKGVEDEARAVRVGDHVSIKCWPLEARKWTPTDGRPAEWFQDLSASKVTVTRVAEGAPKGNPIPSEDIDEPPF